MDPEDTGPGDGVESSAGAVQLEADVADFHTSQHVPSADRTAKVTLPPLPAEMPPMLTPPPSPAPPSPPVTATLTVAELEDGPVTNEIDGLEAESAETVNDP